MIGSKYSIQRLVCILVLLLAPVHVFAQKMVVESRTNEFTDYLISNDSLKAGYQFELMIPNSNSSESWRVLEQEIVQRDINNYESDKIRLLLGEVPENAPILEVLNPGIYRKQNVATLTIYTTRLAPNNAGALLIVKSMRIRVYNVPTWDRSSEFTRLSEIADTNSPLTSGTWYKIPITKDGIHQLDRNYLQALGINVASIDPRNIQIWGTDGYELPRLNSVPRPIFQQIPILVTGESDGSLDAADVVIFYGNSPNKYEFNPSNKQYSHSTHPYSASNFIFLTVGNDAGIRLSEVNLTGNESRAIETFKDFIWKEDELLRPDTRTKSGTQWLGQQFSLESFARTQTIFQDTIPGFIQGSSIDLVVEYAARANLSSRFETRIGNSLIANTSISGINDLNRSDGRSANTGRLSRAIPNVSLNNNILKIDATFDNLGSTATGWLDWIRIRLTRELRPKNNLLHYYSPDDGSSSQIARHILRGFTNRPLVMDVTNPVKPVLYSVIQSDDHFVTSHPTTPGSKYVAQTQFIQPIPGNRIDNQNLRGITDFPDYIIITNDLLFQEALEFADYRRSNGGWNPIVVRQDLIFNEFSGGVMDVSGIRDYIRYLYNRAGQNENQIPKHVLFFADTTFDYKGILKDPRLQNLVITYQSEESYSRGNSYGSDDFFVLLDPNEGNWFSTAGSTSAVERIDMGVGRLPVQSVAEARLVVNKIKSYEDPSNFGDWRTLFTFSSDDDINGNSVERDLHVWNAEGTAESMDRDAGGVRINKIYQINYPVINTPLGRLSPEANQAFINSINNGTLVMNYSGHGSEQLLSAEQLFKSDDISRLTNADRLTIITTATCDFGRFDDPDEQSGAEKMMLYSNGGAVAAFTTTRVVFTSSDINTFNFGLNVQLSQAMLIRDSNGLPSTLGDIYLRTKNTTVGSSFNSRKFLLLGDPAMRIGLPQNEVKITSINDFQLDGENSQSLNLRALDQAVLSGYVTNNDGSINSSFTGEATIKVYDANRYIELPNFLERDTKGCFTPNCQYRVQNDMIFNGQVSVTAGSFNSRFIIPNDIAYSNDKGRILIYSKDPSDADAIGSFSNIIFNGRNQDAVNDNSGPAIEIYLNDTDFIDGGIVNDSPRLLVNLDDKSGINTAGAGVGHELIAELTSYPATGSPKTIVLNNFYRSELDDFTKGKIEYPLDRLEDGVYSLKIRAWDVFNNLSEKEVNFEVASAQELVIRNVYNYPNPMSTYTRFVFEHNQNGQEIDVQIRIYTLSGQPVARLSRDNYISSGNIVQIPWDGRDDNQNHLAAGTYLYHVLVTGFYNGDHITQEKIEKLVIIR